METHGLAAKIIAKMPKNDRNCESSVSRCGGLVIRVTSMYTLGVYDLCDEWVTLVVSNLDIGLIRRTTVAFGSSSVPAEASGHELR